MPPLAMADATGEKPPATVVEKVTAHLRETARNAKLPLLLLSANGTPDAAPAQTAGQTPSDVKPLPKDIQALLDGAAKAKLEFDDDQRQKLLKSAIEQMLERMGEIGQVEPLVTAELELAALYLRGPYPMLADTEFARVVTMRPATELDLRQFPPQAVEAFGRVKQNTLALPRGAINVTGEPAGASIVVNGLPVGALPKVVPVLGGTHLVQLQADGYTTQRKLVRVEAGAEVALPISLARSRTAQVADSLTAALQQDNNRAAALAEAKKLGAAHGATAVIATGLVRIEGGYGLIATLTSSPQRTVVATFDNELSDAGTSCAALFDRLLASPSKAAQGPELVTVTKPPLLFAGVDFDFNRRLLGAPWATDPKNHPAQSGAVSDQVVDEPDTWHRSWIFWTAAGVVIGCASVAALAYSDASNREVFPSTDLGNLQLGK